MTQKSRLNAPLSAMEVVLELATIAGCLLKVFIVVHMREMLPDQIPSKLDPFSGRPAFYVAKAFFIAGVGWTAITNLGLLLISRSSYAYYRLFLEDLYNRFNLHNQIAEHHI